MCGGVICAPSAKHEKAPHNLSADGNKHYDVTVIFYVIRYGPESYENTKLFFQIGTKKIF